jgi:hypothetical protein
MELIVSQPMEETHQEESFPSRYLSTENSMIPGVEERPDYSGFGNEETNSVSSYRSSSTLTRTTSGNSFVPPQIQHCLPFPEDNNHHYPNDDDDYDEVANGIAYQQNGGDRGNKRNAQDAGMFEEYRPPRIPGAGVTTTASSRNERNSHSSAPSSSRSFTTFDTAVSNRTRKGKALRPDLQ